MESELLALQAENCIKNHVIAAMGIGLIPSSLVNIAGIAGIEVKLIRDLANIYAFPVPHQLVAYKILISLIGSIGPVYLSTKMHTALKGVPLIGHAVYVGLLSITGGAAVYAVGKIFQKHYASGGTFLSSDNSVIRKCFKKYYAEGKQVARACAISSEKR
ncbi:DUF697 domain-containing protein [Chrysiogenes arsenatis]|uniref:DUF697 domain-containing protein n=1 Tax=Chrysiogenes arsenatis TaxID=309797 RepID=UPI0003F62215|nr:DUF697 domain-containing protein [Chrysiogenes arsenatis]